MKLPHISTANELAVPIASVIVSAALMISFAHFVPIFAVLAMIVWCAGAALDRTPKPRGPQEHEHIKLSNFTRPFPEDRGIEEFGQPQSQPSAQDDKSSPFSSEATQESPASDTASQHLGQQAEKSPKDMAPTAQVPLLAQVMEVFDKVAEAVSSTPAIQPSETPTPSSTSDKFNSQAPATTASAQLPTQTQLPASEVPASARLSITASVEGNAHASDTAIHAKSEPLSSHIPAGVHGIEVEHLRLRNYA